MGTCHHTTHELKYLTAVNPEAIVVERRRAEQAEVEGNALQLSREDVLHFADGILAVYKPSGVYVQHVQDSAAKWYRSKKEEQEVAGDGLEMSSYQCWSRYETDPSQNHSSDREQNESTFLQLVHRLDRDTSGVLLLATCRAASNSLHRAFNLGQATKTYVCLCTGLKPAWQQITVDTGHGRSKHGLWRIYDHKDIGRELPGGSRIRNARTHFWVESMVPKERQGSSDSTALATTTKARPSKEEACRREEDSIFWIRLRAQPVTGRTHQIRLHCAYLGLPIAGDLKYYGTPFDCRGKPLEHHLLHAESLELPHPSRCQEVVELFAPRPLWTEHNL
mmetsp:Transcript_1245/g.8187  ORF Transcript_1245/g.8187 Transcript_1245/m.8187 type:complete len:335 (+) Transcript_1245:43-1047(+)